MIHFTSPPNPRLVQFLAKTLYYLIKHDATGHQPTRRASVYGPQMAGSASVDEHHAASKAAVGHAGSNRYAFCRVASCCQQVEGWRAGVFRRNSVTVECH